MNALKLSALLALVLLPAIPVLADATPPARNFILKLCRIRKDPEPVARSCRERAYGNLANSTRERAALSVCKIDSRILSPTQFWERGNRCFETAVRDIHTPLAGMVSSRCSGISYPGQRFQCWRVGFEWLVHPELVGFGDFLSRYPVHSSANTRRTPRREGDSEAVNFILNSAGPADLPRAGAGAAGF